MGNNVRHAVSWLGELVAPWVTWALVVAVPIAVGTGLRHRYPHSPAAVAWLVGALLFATLFCTAELLWRGIRWLLTLGCPESRSRR